MGQALVVYGRVAEFHIQTKMETLRTLGAPYTDAEIEAAPQELEGKTELDALIAYLQGLGTELKSRRQ